MQVICSGRSKKGERLHPPRERTADTQAPNSQMHALAPQSRKSCCAAGWRRQPKATQPTSSRLVPLSSLLSLCLCGLGVPSLSVLPCYLTAYKESVSPLLGFTKTASLLLQQQKQ